MFKDPSSHAGRHQSHPGLASSPSMPETCLEDDWLHTTYSNGELASFVSLPSELGDVHPSSTPHRRLTSSCSIPSLQSLPLSPASPPSQRWSTAAASEKEDHVYSSIKRNPSFVSPPSTVSMSSPISHCQSVSSVSSKQQDRDQSGLSVNGPALNRSMDRCHIPSLGSAGRQRSLPERSTQGQSDLTLHDGQQVVVLNRASTLSILSATQNYLTNFKDNGEDDDDYVEIRSEDENERVQDGPAQRSGSAVLSNQNLHHSQSLPCTPVRSCTPLRSLDRKELEKYLWSEPQHSQPKIVQSLREKLQCLSSSSFA